MAKNQIHSGIRLDGQLYGPGSELAFEQALEARKEKLDARTLQQHADSGVLSGFGTQSAEEKARVASGDPTLTADPSRTTNYQPSENDTQAYMGEGESTKGTVNVLGVIQPGAAGASAAVEGDTLPPVKELEEQLQGMTVEAIEAQRATDERRTAQPIYERVLEQKQNGE